MKRTKDVVKILLKLGFTVLLIYLISQKINLGQVKKVFLNSEPSFIFFALVSYFLSQLAASWRLLQYLHNIGIKVSYSYNLKLYLLGSFYNVFLPGGIGGDGFKIYILRRKFQLPTKKIFLAMFFDRLSGLWAIGLLCVCLVLLIPQIAISKVVPVAALSTGTLIYFFVLRRFFPDYAKHFISSHFKACMVQGLQQLSIIFILLSQGFAGKFSPYLFSFLVSSIATIIPVSFGGFGLREYVMTHASGIFNMNQNLAVFVTLTFLILSTIAALPGIWFIYRSKEFANPPDPEEAKAFEREADKTASFDDVNFK